MKLNPPDLKQQQEKQTEDKVQAKKLLRKKFFTKQQQSGLTKIIAIRIDRLNGWKVNDE